MNQPNGVAAHRLDTKEDVNFSCERAIAQCFQIVLDTIFESGVRKSKPERNLKCKPRIDVRATRGFRPWRFGLRFWDRNIAFTLILVTFSVIACRSLPPLPPVNLKQPGWTLREGQAVWKLAGKKSEIAGEVLIATRPEECQSFVQFSKAPFPLVIAQNTTNGWQIETPAENRRYSGKGNPPKRIIWLYLARVLEGQPPPKHWSWHHDGNEWHLENRTTGESVEGFFIQ